MNESVPLSPSEPRAPGNLLAPLSLADHWTPERVLRLRTAMGLTQRAFAKEIGIAYPNVNCWERGKHKPSGPACTVLDQLEAIHIRPSGLTTADMRLSLERLGASMGICVSAPVKASREWLMAEHARLTSLRTRLYGQMQP